MRVEFVARQFGRQTQAKVAQMPTPDRRVRTLLYQAATVGRSSWIPERSATCLREADLNVLSKLGNQGLEWRLEPEAFTRREVRREDDLLDILVGCPIDIQVAWQPST